MKKYILILIMAFTATFANAQTDRFIKMSDTTATKKIATKSQLATKQDKLVSGTTIKTVNGTSLLGSGNLVLETSGGFVDTISNQIINGVKSFKNDAFINGVKFGVGSYDSTIVFKGSTASGRSALANNTTGNFNTATGFGALYYNTTGNYNTADGQGSLSANITGSNITAIGGQSLFEIVQGDNNTAVGAYSGTGVSYISAATFNNSVFVGSYTSPLADNQTNQIVIGHRAVGQGSNSVTLGNTDITTTRLRGQVLGGSFVKDGGTSSQFLMADGSVSTGINMATNINGNTGYISRFTGTSTIANSNIFDDGTNVGVGTAAPANKLEIKHGTAGNSGLRFTNLNANSTATTSTSKVLSVNATGDVILTNVPGTQNIVAFSTATPTTGGVMFTPNQPADKSVIYQSNVDNSLWTYNGTTYVTYTAPATTGFNLLGTSNDAGSNKTSTIWRSGGISVGVTSTAPIYGNLTVRGGASFSGVPAYGTSSIGLINNPTATWSGSGFLFANSTVGSNAFSMVFNNDRAFFGTLSPTNTNAALGTWSSTGLLVGSLGTPINRLDVFGGTALGIYASVNSAPTNGLIVSGNTGIGTSTPGTNLHVNNATISTATINADAQVLRLSRTQNPGVKWDNVAQFNLGSFSSAIQANTRLDLAMSDGLTASPNNTVMTWQSDGRIGIGTTAPNISAKIEMSSTTQGFLPPRMTNAQRIAIATPATGLVVYVTDGTTEGLWVKKAAGWVQLATL